MSFTLPAVGRNRRRRGATVAANRRRPPLGPRDGPKVLRRRRYSDPKFLKSPDSRSSGPAPASDRRPSGHESRIRDLETGPLSNATPQALKEVLKEIELDQCGAGEIINTSLAAQCGHGPRQDLNLDKHRVTGNTRGKTRGGLP